MVASGSCRCGLGDKAHRRGGVRLAMGAECPWYMAFEEMAQAGDGDAMEAVVGAQAAVLQGVKGFRKRSLADLIGQLRDAWETARAEPVEEEGLGDRGDSSTGPSSGEDGTESESSAGGRERRRHARPSRSGGRRDSRDDRIDEILLIMRGLSTEIATLKEGVRQGQRRRPPGLRVIGPGAYQVDHFDAMAVRGKACPNLHLFSESGCVTMDSALVGQTVARGRATTKASALPTVRCITGVPTLIGALARVGEAAARPPASDVAHLHTPEAKTRRAAAAAGIPGLVRVIIELAGGRDTAVPHLIRYYARVMRACLKDEDSDRAWDNTDTIDMALLNEIIRAEVSECCTVCGQTECPKSRSGSQAASGATKGDKAAYTCIQWPATLPVADEGTGGAADAGSAS